jgi:hypothetical protein
MTCGCPFLRRSRFAVAWFLPLENNYRAMGGHVLGRIGLFPKNPSSGLRLAVATANLFS